MSDELIRKVVLSAYSNEPCRICGQMLTEKDIDAGAVFVGYNPDNKSRAAHKRCFENARAVFGEEVGRLKQALLHTIEAVNEFVFDPQVRNAVDGEHIARWDELVSTLRRIKLRATKEE